MNNLFQTYDNELPSERVLFLYHGTGGNETDLLPLVQPFSQSHRIVGLRGNVQERGMNRFFLRNQDGTFVKESVLEEVVKLQSFLKLSLTSATRMEQTLSWPTFYCIQKVSLLLPCFTQSCHSFHQRTYHWKIIGCSYLGVRTMN